MASTIVHSDEAWQTIKPIFLELYLDQNKTLDEVASELAQRYGFVTSKNAYKKRITQWVAFKNYKAFEKEELAARRGPTDSLAIRGKPVKWDRVHRHARSRLPKQQVEMYQVDHVAHPAGARGHRRFALEVAPTLRPPLLDPNEILLGAIRNFLNWHFTMRQHYTATHPDQSALLYTKFFYATRLTRNPLSAHHGWRTIQCFRSNVQSTVKYSPMAVLLVCLDGDLRLTHGLLVQEMLSFMRKACMLWLPAWNPLRQFLTRVQDFRSLSCLAGRMAVLKFDLVKNLEIADSSADQNELLSASIAAVYAWGSYEYANEFLIRLLGQPATDTQLKITLLLILSQSYLVKSDFQTAISTCYQSVRLIDKFGTLADRLHWYGSVHEILALCHDELGEQNLSLAAHHATFRFGLRARHFTEVIASFHAWEWTLRRYGRWDEHNILKAKYGFMFDLDIVYQPEVQIVERLKAQIEADAKKLANSCPTPAGTGSVNHVDGIYYTDESIGVGGLNKADEST